MSFVLAAAVAALSVPAVAAAAPHKKATKKHHKKKVLTEQQKIAAAVKVAERSPDLWATVNACTSAPTGDTVGIRGQMPGLGIPATLSMSVSASYWNYTTSMFQASGASLAVPLGTGTHGLRQGGVNFPFVPPAAGSTYLVRGTITFEWMIGGKVVGKVTKNTGHGYANVGLATPPGYSAGTCTLT